MVVHLSVCQVKMDKMAFSFSVLEVAMHGIIIMFDNKLYFSSPTGAAVDSLNTGGDCSCTHCNSDVYS